MVGHDVTSVRVEGPRAFTLESIAYLGISGSRSRKLQGGGDCMCRSECGDVGNLLVRESQGEPRHAGRDGCPWRVTRRAWSRTEACPLRRSARAAGGWSSTGRCRARRGPLWQLMHWLWSSCRRVHEVAVRGEHELADALRAMALCKAHSATTRSGAMGHASARTGISPIPATLAPMTPAITARAHAAQKRAGQETPPHGRRRGLHVTSGPDGCHTGPRSDLSIAVA